MRLEGLGKLIEIIHLVWARTSDRGTHDHILLSLILDLIPGRPHEYIYSRQKQGSPTMSPDIGFPTADWSCSRVCDRAACSSGVRPPFGAHDQILNVP
jgi:hypothetical protein